MGNCTQKENECKLKKEEEEAKQQNIAAQVGENIRR